MEKKFTKKIKVGMLLSAVLAVVVVLSGCSNNNSNKTVPPVPGAITNQPANNPVASAKGSSAIDTDKDGIPDNAEVVLGTDPQNPDTDGDGINDKADQNPTRVDIVFQKSTGENGFAIQSVLVENNIDEATKKGTSDHLELILKNTGTKAISDFSAYYEFIDQTDGSKQSYELPLTGLTLATREVKSVHIDLSGLPGHFRANPNSSYYQTANAKDVNVIVSAPGFSAQEMNIKKDKGGAETAD